MFICDVTSMSLSTLQIFLIVDDGIYNTIFFLIASFLQYMKAIRATLTTSQPVISEEEFGTMFYKIQDLHALHETFLDELQKKAEKWDNKTTIGEQFKVTNLKSIVHLIYNLI